MYDFALQSQGLAVTRGPTQQRIRIYLTNSFWPFAALRNNFRIARQNEAARRRTLRVR
jgi:hypothetical protein